MDWQECLDNKLVKNLRTDKELIESLIIISRNKAISASRLKLDEISATSIIVLYYDSLRELLEALALSRGFKIYNHECYTSFLKDILGEKEISLLYDNIRKIRNSINYYGRKLSLEEAETIIFDIKKLIEICKKLLNKNILK